MLQQTRHFLELIRFSHTVFALPFALLAAVMAWALGAQETPPRGFQWQELLGVLVCMVAARSAAMGFNRLVDRDIDAENPRTKARHLPAGLLTVNAVRMMVVLSGLAFIAGTLLFLPNWLPFALSMPVLAFLCGYSYAKRFTSLAHYWLGAALMLAPICAWIALRGEIILQEPSDILPAVVLGLAVLFWVGGFDLLYACQDADFDRAAKLNSLPARYGIPTALAIAKFSHVLMLACLTLLPFLYPAFGVIHWIGLGVVAALVIYQHSLVRADDLSRVNQAFFNVNAILGIGLFIVGSIDAWI
jgi:4-hydroxybenzoate polyprenyltransferase